MGGKTRASGNRKDYNSSSDERTNERTKGKRDGGRRPKTRGGFICRRTVRCVLVVAGDARVSLARRFARCVQNVFVFRDAVGAGARFRSRETYRTKKTDAGMTIPSSFQRRSMRSIRAVSRYSALRGGRSVVAGLERPAARPRRSAKLDRRNSRQKVTTTPLVAARLASFLSSSPSGILWWSLRRSWSSRGETANVPRTPCFRPPARLLRRATERFRPPPFSSHPCRPQMRNETSLGATLPPRAPNALRFRRRLRLRASPPGRTLSSSSALRRLPPRLVLSFRGGPGT